jgi:hypothetical protein
MISFPGGKDKLKRRHYGPNMSEMWHAHDGVFVLNVT